MMYFLTGSLPWQGVKGKTSKEKYDKIMAMKIDYTPERLCEGHPHEFLEYFQYCRNLQFEEKPDYIHIRELFKSVMLTNNDSADLNLFDWRLINEETDLSSSTKDENDNKKPKSISADR